ncbi:MAG: 50S ribosomal protein L18 [Microgenomates group bacterium]
MSNVNQRLKIIRKQKRVRGRIPREGYRLSVFRSNRFLFAQIIDNKTGKTILGLFEKKVLDNSETENKTKTERARLFGLKFAKEALAKKIKRVVFDRGQYRYHGRIKAFAEGAREGKLEF